MEMLTARIESLSKHATGTIWKLDDNKKSKSYSLFQPTFISPQICGAELICSLLTVTG